MIFKKGYCEKGWAALINADFWIQQLCCGNFISVELMRNEIEINSLCKDFEIS